MAGNNVKRSGVTTIMILVASFIVAIILWVLYLGRSAPTAHSNYGVTFSTKEANALGISPAETYGAILTDLNVKYLRLAAYWDVIQPEPKEFDFSELDEELGLAEENGAKVILAIGRKLPRWPECFIPTWAKESSVSEQQQSVLDMLNVVVSRYNNHPAVVGWQLENEPFVSWFGDCPKPDPKFLAIERDLVRSLSDKPIMITDSGELSSWRQTIHFGDIFGTTMYRVVWNKWLGYGYYPLPPAFYRLKARLWKMPLEKVVISELQAEPWTPGKPAIEVPLEEQFRAMDITRFRANIAFARETGFGDIYFWGAEWWYWLKQNGHPEFWDEAKKIFEP